MCLTNLQPQQLRVAQKHLNVLRCNPYLMAMDDPNRLHCSRLEKSQQAENVAPALMLYIIDLNRV